MYFNFNYLYKILKHYSLKFEVLLNVVVIKIKIITLDTYWQNYNQSGVDGIAIRKKKPF